MLQDFGYFKAVVENLEKINATKEENIRKAAALMCEAIENDRLIHVYGGGGHTTLPVGEMFFRAGGLSCINPVMETGLSVFNQALKYLELERTVIRQCHHQVLRPAEGRCAHHLPQHRHQPRHH